MIQAPQSTVASTYSAGGDINGDGFDDILAASGSVSAYVIFGGPQLDLGLADALVQGSGAFSGTPAAEALVGSSGNDTLSGGGGIDRLYGGRGHDTFVLNDSDIAHLTNTTPGGPKARINGGGGMDTLRLSGGASLNLGSIPNPGVVSLNIQSRIESIERIDLAQDSAANGLTIGATDVADMSGMNLFNTDNGWRNLLGSPLTSTVRRHQVIVNGNANDNVTLDITDPDNLDVVGWERVMQQGSAALVQDSQNLRYEVWNHSHNASQLLIQQGIPVLPA